MSTSTINFIDSKPLQSEVDLGVISDNDLFKYFLNSDFVEPDSANEFLLSSPTSIPENTNSDSPLFSPPQLSPDRNDFINSAPLISVPLIPAFGSNLSNNSNVTIKEEPTVQMDLNGKSKGSRKRSSLKPEANEVPSALSREELLKLSYKSIDTISSKCIPPEEEKQIKRQKRLIKNRESAQLSRLRKKIYIEDLERKVNHLTSDNEALNKQVLMLNSDKKKLQEEVLYFQSLIKQSPDLSTALANRKIPFQPKNVKAAGSNPKSFGRSSVREETTELSSKSTLYTGRILKSVVEEPNISEIVPLQKPSFSDIEIPTIKSTPATKKEINIKEKKHSLEDSIEKDPKQIDLSKRKKMKFSDDLSEKYSPEKSLVPMKSTNSDSLLDSLQIKETVTNELVPRRNPNAAYIYCPEAHHLAPLVSTSGPEMVALLLPASVLNGTLYRTQPNIESSLLEVSCQILNLHMWPINSSYTSPQ